MWKYLYVILALLSTHAKAQNFMDPANPVSPLNPLSPLNSNGIYADRDHKPERLMWIRIGLSEVSPEIACSYSDGSTYPVYEINFSIDADGGTRVVYRLDGYANYRSPRYAVGTEVLRGELDGRLYPSKGKRFTRDDWKNFLVKHIKPLTTDRGETNWSIVDCK